MLTISKLIAISLCLTTISFSIDLSTEESEILSLTTMRILKPVSTINSELFETLASQEDIDLSDEFYADIDALEIQCDSILKQLSSVRKMNNKLSFSADACPLSIEIPEDITFKSTKAKLREGATINPEQFLHTESLYKEISVFKENIDAILKELDRMPYLYISPPENSPTSNWTSPDQSGKVRQILTLSSDANEELTNLLARSKSGDTPLSQLGTSEF